MEETTASLLTGFVYFVYAHETVSCIVTVATETVQTQHTIRLPNHPISPPSLSLFPCLQVQLQYALRLILSILYSENLERLKKTTRAE